MGRVGTLAINRFIADHPQIHLHNYIVTKERLKSRSHTFDDLFIDKSYNTLQQGIVIHDSVFLDKRYRKKLGILNEIKTSSTIHLIRNPYEQVLSWINHINASASMGILGWKNIEPTAKSFYVNYPREFKTIMSGHQCQMLYRNSKQIKVIDFKQILDPTIEKTMEEIYDFIGVDPNYKCPLLKEKQNSYALELLYKGIVFELNNEVIHMAMMPHDLYFHAQKDQTPWIIIHDTDEIYKLCPTLPAIKGDLIFMPKSVEAHNKLSLKTRQMLHDGIRNIVSELLGVWVKDAEKIAQTIEANKLLSLSDDDIDFLNNTLKPDLQLLYKYHPKFKSLWNL